MEKPDDQEAQVTLGEVLNSEGRYGEAADFYLRAKLPYMAAWSYYRNRQAPAVSYTHLLERHPELRERLRRQGGAG